MSTFCDRTSQGSSTPLCQRCAEIDLDWLLYDSEDQVSNSRPQEAVKPEGKSYLTLGPAIPGSFVSWCGLCQFFSAISPSPDLGPKVPNQRVVIRDVNTEENFGQFYSEGRLIPSSPGQLFVARECVTASGSIYSLGNAFCALGPSRFARGRLVKGRTIEPDCIDYRVIRDWINHCKETHVECRGPYFMPLRLIYCKRRIITKVVEHVAYAALSYVWGNASISEKPSATDQLLSNLPATVEDAISVTLALGYDYLWIDRYCINQHGGDEKAQEIARMDEIYEGAEIVIINAAGDDPALGLPGVSRQRSVAQLRVATTTHTLVSLMSYPVNEISTSKWATRGWTYQEGVLAKRRLFFTSEQVYFECGVYGCMETLSHPLIHPDSGVASIRLTNVISDIKSAGTIVISDYLIEYSKRHLSYTSDVLNAFRGIFHMLERQSPPILHCGGVPLLNNDLDIQVSTSTSSLLGFLRGLCWNAPWEDAVRQPGFPSWSWTGWQCLGGGVDFHELNFSIFCSLSWLYAHCDDRTVQYPIEYSSEAEVAKQRGGERMILSIPSSPGALYMRGNVVTFSYLRQGTAEHFCSGSTTRNILFEHKKYPSRAIGECAKPIITHLYNAGISKGPQSLSAIQFIQNMDHSQISATSSTNPSDSSHDTTSNGPGSFILAFLLLKDIQDTFSKIAPQRVFERVGLLVLDFTTSQTFQMSDWFLEANEQQVVVV
ncbi:HET-domain-containing protein [Xylaria sp. FL1042]|nr:HET-domain-containing protein [Xylaria sp. FL1042]